MISLLFNLGVYASAFLAYGMVHRQLKSVRSSTTYQRLRWSRLAVDRGLVSTGSSGELTGTWKGLPVVLDLRPLAHKEPALGLRVQGLHAPSELLRAFHTQACRRGWSLTVAGGDLQLHVPFRGAGPHVDEIEAWLAAIEERNRVPDHTYR